MNKSVIKTSDQGADQFLLSDFGFFQKSVELWANHFMGVFYLWTGVVVVPTTVGGLFSNIGAANEERIWLYGVVCIFVSIIAVFVSLKMFDIRKAQLRNIEIINRIREIAYDKLEITIRYGLRPYAKKNDLSELASKDFGHKMAIVMALVNGFVMAVGVTTITFGLLGVVLAMVAGLIFGAVLAGYNYREYFSLVVYQTPGKLNKKDH